MSEAAPIAGPTGSVRSRLRAPLVAAAVIGLAALALRLRDPHRHASWGLCPFKLATGWDCPACGGLRAVNDLTHGQVVAAWHSNALFVSALPLIAIGWLLWVHRSIAGPSRSAPVPGRRRRTVLVTVAVVLAIGFTVWRNTPWGSALHVA